MASIEKKKNGSYLIRVSKGYDVRGKQVKQTRIWRPPSGMTERKAYIEVQRQADIFEAEFKDGYTKTSEKFEAFAENWIDNIASLSLKLSSLNTYRWLSVRVYKHIGHMPIDRITVLDLQRFISNLARDGRQDARGGRLTSKTIKMHLSFVSTVFDYAVKTRQVQSNPCTGVVLPKPNPKEKEIYTIAEIKDLIQLLLKDLDNEVCNLPYTVFFFLVILLGIRRGECLGLEFSDIDWDNRLITLRRASYYNTKNGIYTDTLKTKSSQRTLMVSDGVFKMLERLRDYQYAHYGSGVARLFTSHDGTPMSPSNPQNYLNRLCRRNNFRCLSIHSFRHLNASLAIANGVDVQTVSSLLGHSSPVTTMGIYTHTISAAKVNAVGTISNVLGL